MRAIGKQQKSQRQATRGQQLGNPVQTNFIPSATDAASTSSNTKRPRSITPPPVQIELIRPGKQKVKIPMNVVKSTPPRRMRAATLEVEDDE